MAVFSFFLAAQIPLGSSHPLTEDLPLFCYKVDVFVSERRGVVVAAVLLRLCWLQKEFGDGDDCIVSVVVLLW